MQFRGQHIVNGVLALALIFFIYGFVVSQSWLDFVLLLALAFALGVLIIIPIGGADMPVVGVDAQQLLGLGRGPASASRSTTPCSSSPRSLVGSSGAILSYNHVQGDETARSST